MSTKVYKFKIEFKDKKRKDHLCQLLEKDKMKYEPVGEEVISFTTDEYELGKYVSEIEKMAGDPDYLMDLDAIWSINKPNEIRLSGMQIN